MSSTKQGLKVLVLLLLSLVLVLAIQFQVLSALQALQLAQVQVLLALL
jgi:hypothetical protein